MKISVITPSIRPQGLEIVANALKKQDFKDFEWIICAPQHLKVGIENALRDTIPYFFIGNPPLKKGQFWDLNYSYNRMIEKSNNNIIISWQDNIWAKPDALSKFFETVKAVNAPVSGIGDQYLQLNRWGKPEIKSWADPRRTTQYGTFYEVNHDDIEWNFCACPKQLLIDVGGADEKLDFLGRGGDMFQITDRLNDLGVKFWIDQTNESFTLQHDRSNYGGEEEWNKSHILLNGKYNERKKQLIEENKWPILDYLK